MYGKKGKFSKRSKGKGELKHEEKRSMYEACEFDGAPEPMERKYMKRYRKTALGRQQYEGKGELDY